MIDAAPLSPHHLPMDDRPATYPSQRRRRPVPPDKQELLAKVLAEMEPPQDEPLIASPPIRGSRPSPAKRPLSPALALLGPVLTLAVVYAWLHADPATRQASAAVLWAGFAILLTLIGAGVAFALRSHGRLTFLTIPLGGGGALGLLAMGLYLILRQLLG